MTEISLAESPSPGPERPDEVEAVSAMPAPMAVGSRKLHYLPTLDAWRAVAALLVVGCHAVAGLSLWQIPGSRIHLESPRWQARLMGIFNGSLGVDLFFALSGFLITYLSIREKETPGGFCLRAFWIRRFFRIVPLAWTYVIVFLIAAAVGWPNAPLPEAGVIAAGFSFYVNYLLAQGRVPTLLGHLWTLGIEMQFYLLWGVVLKLVRPHLVTAVALVGIVLVILCRSTSGETGIVWEGLRLGSCGDSLLWGAVFGATLARDARQRWLQAWLRSRYFAPLCALLAYVADQHPPGYATWEPLLCALLITITVIHGAEAPFHWMEADFLRFLGRISFSIYIWQQVLCGAASTEPGKAWNALLVPPVSLLWVIPVAWLSYRWIELPGMRFAVWLARRQRQLA